MELRCIVFPGPALREEISHETFSKPSLEEEVGYTLLSDSSAEVTRA